MTEHTLSAPAPTQEDKIMAALAHVSILLPLMGVIAPIVIWATQKDKSAFVGFQALQAAAYQISLIVVWFLGIGCYMCSFFGMFFLIPGGLLFAETEADWLAPLFGLPFFLPFAIIGTMLLVMLAFVVYGLIAAVLVLQGRPFRYVLVANGIERYLARSTPPAPAHPPEDPTP
jgi:uncharacterized Tic20 family protein